MNIPQSLYTFTQAMASIDVEAIAAELPLNFGHPGPHEEHIKISSLLEKRHVFGIYPTGFGKSDCFAYFPLITDKVSLQ